jgi:hypothetical protein
MKNWKTTLGGILSAAGIGMAGSGNGTMHIVGTIIASVGALLMGGAAKDNNVTGGTTQQ